METTLVSRHSKPHLASKRLHYHPTIIRPIWVHVIRLWDCQQIQHRIFSTLSKFSIPTIAAAFSFVVTTPYIAIRRYYYPSGTKSRGLQTNVQIHKNWHPDAAEKYFIDIPQDMRRLKRMKTWFYFRPKLRIVVGIHPKHIQTYAFTYFSRIFYQYNTYSESYLKRLSVVSKQCFKKKKNHNDSSIYNLIYCKAVAPIYFPVFKKKKILFVFILQ